MKSTTMGALFSLTALLSGCDDNQQKELAVCDMEGLQVKVVYHQVYSDTDYTTLDFYKEGRIIAQINPSSSIRDTWIQCDDGRRLNMVFGTPEVYFSSASEKK